MAIEPDLPLERAKGVSRIIDSSARLQGMAEIKFLKA
jgi:D-mannonate dehydratase